VRNGFTQLRQLDLTFDAWLYFHQLPGLVDLANAFPGTTIIADHIGGPVGIGPYTGKRNEVFLEWRKNMTALAACPNVVVKLGGMGMPEMGLGWDKAPQKPDSAEVAEALTPYFTFCIEKFGTKRCMFESNFPADKLAYSYSVVWNAFKRIAADYSAGERADLFHDTAVRVYRL
jgi:predicted TIM-barrel fold metal-dependent hydrolase